MYSVEPDSERSEAGQVDGRAKENNQLRRVEQVSSRFLLLSSSNVRQHSPIDALLQPDAHFTTLFFLNCQCPLEKHLLALSVAPHLVRSGPDELLISTKLNEDA